jgi:aminoglycoside phosphotransferase
MGHSSDGGHMAELLAIRRLDATGVDGSPADGVEYRFDIEHTVGMLAEVLAQLHSTPVADAAAAGAVRLSPADLVDEARRAAPAPPRLSAAYQHMSRDRLLEVLAESAPRDSAEQALTHGRPVLGNLRCHRGVPVGLVGWDGLALADVHRDLAVAARSIAADLGPVAVPGFFEAYSRSSDGWMPDVVRLDWYALAAELTG